VGVTTRAVRTALGIAAAVAIIAMSLGSASLAPVGVQDDGAMDHAVARLVELAAGSTWVEAGAVTTSEVVTQGTIAGDFMSAAAALQDVHDDLVELFVTADDGSRPADAAVAQAARGLLLLEEAYGALAVASTAIPLYTYDEDDVFNGADPDLLHLTKGWELLAEAHARLATAYSVLVNDESLERSARDGVARLLAELRAYETAARPALHELFSEYATQELYTLDRFKGGLPGDAPARVITVACLPAGSLFDIDPSASFVTTTDCPALPSPDLPDFTVDAEPDAG